MIIYIYDDKFRRVNILKEWDFYSYTERFNGIGDFTIRAKLSEENKYLMSNKTFYLSFDDNFIAKIEDIKKDADSPYFGYFMISGRFVEEKLNKRIIYRTQNFKGNSCQIAENILNDNVINPTYLPSERKLSFVFKNDVSSTLNLYDVQHTGDKVLDSIIAQLKKDRLGFKVVPNFIFLDEKNPNEVVTTNISSFTFIIKQGRDLTRQTVKGTKLEKEIVFSQKLSNLARVTLEIDKIKNSNVAYVGGEGEGLKRKWITVDKSKSVGWERDEIYVDARHITSTTDGGNTIPESEYLKLLDSKGIEELNKTKIQTFCDGTIINQNEKYKYNRDIFLGDFVTIEDIDFPEIKIKAQIISATTSIDSNKEIVDLEFEAVDILV